MPAKKRVAIPASVAARLAECRRRMSAQRVPAFLVTRPPDLRHLAGFTGEDSAGLVTPRAVHIITDGRFDHTCEIEIPWATKHLRHGMLVDEIGAVCGKLKLKRLAVQLDGMTAGMFETLKRLSKPTKLVPAKPICESLRTCKDKDEIRLIRKAIRIAEDAFLAIRGHIRPGATEEALAAELEYEMKKRGSSCAAFTTICAVDANAAHPHAHSGRRKVRSGSAVLFDWGATVSGYHSDLTRVVFVDRIPPRIGEIYRIVLDAQVAAIAALRPGARMDHVDAVARGVVTDAGFGEFFIHGLGHGLGLDVHESPSLSWRSKAKLETGMVVTVEPGIYLPGVGGVRIEDDVLITPNGCSILSRLDKSLSGAVV